MNSKYFISNKKSKKCNILEVFFSMFSSLGDLIFDKLKLKRAQILSKNI